MSSFRVCVQAILDDVNNIDEPDRVVHEKIELCYADILRTRDRDRALRSQHLNIEESLVLPPRDYDEEAAAQSMLPSQNTNPSNPPTQFIGGKYRRSKKHQRSKKHRC